MQPICVDYETFEILPDGSTTASVDAFKSNFRVSSMAATEYDEFNSMKSYYFIGEEACYAFLKTIQDRPIIAHNIQYEMLVTACRFPDLKMNWYCDTMRLAQNYDNGGDDSDFELVTVEEIEAGEEPVKKWKPLSGLGLVKCLKRILKDRYVDHKREAYEWIQKNVPGVKPGKEGRFLDKLPADVMERYNVGDTENTLALYTYITNVFERESFDWTFDHGLFLNSVQLIVGSKMRGILVDRDALHTTIVLLKQELIDIATNFRAKFIVEIRQIEQERLIKYASKPKTPKGKHKRLVRALHDKQVWNDDIAFNVGSNAQLQRLFVGIKRCSVKFFTDKGSPSFKSIVLKQYGDGGEMLKIRRKRLLVLKQSESLQTLSDYDGRFRADLKACGTATGRYAGGSH